MLNCSHELRIFVGEEDKSAKPKLEKNFKHNLNSSRYVCPGVGY